LIGFPGKGVRVVLERKRGAGKRFRAFVFKFFVFLLFLNLSCFGPAPRINPPAEINNFGGQASFYARGHGREGRVRLSFYFQLPEKARLEVFNPLGGLESVLWLNGPEAVLYIPKEKAYWRGETIHITADFLGGSLACSELSAIFSARWAVLDSDHGWEIFRDQSGVVTGGMRQELEFAIKETFADTEIPKIVYFESGELKVRVRLLKMRFNQLLKEALFVPSFQAGAKEVSWEQISELWKR